jgi:hypothetical protein
MAGGLANPLRVVVVSVTSTFQALPGQGALMCSATSLARSTQIVSPPERIPAFVGKLLIIMKGTYSIESMPKIRWTAATIGSR